MDGASFSVPHNRPGARRPTAGSLLEDHLAPGGGHLQDGFEDLGASHLGQVLPGDPVGVVDIDVLTVVGLEAQGGEFAAQLDQDVGGVGGQLGVGGYFSIATGRAHRTFTPQIEKEGLVFNAPVVLSNGAAKCHILQ